MLTTSPEKNPTRSVYEVLISLCAVVGLVWLLIGYHGSGSGFWLSEQLVPLAAITLLLPAAASGWPQMRWSWWPIAWLGAPMVAFAAGQFRANIVAQITWIVAVAAGAGAFSYIAKRFSVERVLFWVLGVATLRYVVAGLFGFFFTEHASRSDVLPALGWHNQSAVVYGILAVGWLGVALRTTWRRFTGWPAALSGTCLALSYTTGSRAGFAFSLLWLLGTAVILRSRTRTAVGALVVAAVVCALFAGMMKLYDTGPASQGPGVSTSEQVEVTEAGRAGSDASSSVTQRFQFWDRSLQMFAERPVLGFGPGSFRFAQEAFTPVNEEYGTFPHNVALEVLGEGGVLWFAAFVAVLGLAAFSFLSRVRRLPEETHTWWRVLLGWCGALVLAHSLFDVSMQFPALSTLVGVGVGAVWLSHETQRRDMWLSGAAVVLSLAMLIPGLSWAWTQTMSLGLGGSSWDLEAPWRTEKSRSIIWLNIDGGHVDWAAEQARQHQRWNPGSPDLELVETLRGVELGATDPDALVELFSDSEPHMTLGWYARGAAVLARNGHVAEARAVADAGWEALQAATPYRWEGNGALAQTRVVLIAESTSCEEAYLEAARMVEKMPALQDARLDNTIDELCRGDA